jgi:hypothetical protein
MLNDVKRDEFDDLPASPGAAPAVAVETAGDASMFDGVEKKGELISAGTKHFRTAGIVWEGFNKMLDENKVQLKYVDGTDIDDQPTMSVRLVCQQEPETGKSMTVFVPWVSATLRSKAAAGDGNAKAQLKRRLVEAKAMMEAAGYKPPSSFDFKRDFLSINPEFKVQVGVRNSKKTGEDNNIAIKYFPLQRPS